MILERSVGGAVDIADEETLGIGGGGRKIDLVATLRIGRDSSLFDHTLGSAIVTDNRVGGSHNVLIEKEDLDALHGIAVGIEHLAFDMVLDSRDAIHNGGFGARGDLRVVVGGGDGLRFGRSARGKA